MEEKNRKNPFWNAKLTSEERLDWLLANMTLEEKITCMASTIVPCLRTNRRYTVT